MPRTADPFAEPLEDDPPLEASVPTGSAAVEDPFEPIDDEEGTEDLGEVIVRPPAQAATPVDDEGGDDDPFEVIPRQARVKAEARPDPRPIVPVQTTARIDGETVQALLAPSMPTSTWRGAPKDAAGLPHRIELAGVSVEIELDCLPGAPLLVLGRDVLAGRVLVEA